jgi:hypothetical protein
LTFGAIGGNEAPVEGGHIGGAMGRVSDDELLNWSGHVPDTVEVNGERWVVKPEGRRELLGYLLGAGLVNVAEVRLAPKVPGPRMGLVRLAENYTLGDLPVQNLDEAVASELAFSLWIRRRDTHGFNRAYIDGVPLFFDHGSAFEYAGLRQFLQSGPDNGYVPSWRVIRWDTDPTTLEVRMHNDATSEAIHPVADRGRFFDRLGAWVDRLRDLSARTIAEAVDGAGFGRARADEMIRFLVRSQRELPAALRRTRRLLERA